MSSALKTRTLLDGFSEMLSSFKNSGRTTISTRLLTYVISFSSVFALIQTVVQLKANYDAGINDVQHQFQQIELSYVSSLTQALWEVDPEQILNIATGINHLSNVVLVTVEEHAEDTLAKDDQLVSVGALNNHRYLSRKISLNFTDMGEKLRLGDLEVFISLESLDRSIYQQTLFLLGFQALKTFSVSIFMLAIFHYLVTQHLIKMTDFSLRIDINNLNEQLQLDRSSKFQGDELWTMSNAINGAKKSLRDLMESKQSKLALEMELQQRAEKERFQQEHNAAIETKNNQLAEQNEALATAIAGQKLAQQQLVQSEKMAALGRLVSGMAHEMNTPLGILKMTHSMSMDSLVALEHSQGEQVFLQFKKRQEKYNELTEKNIQRSANLIEAFKQVSNDETDAPAKDFVIEHELTSCLHSLSLHKNANFNSYSITGDPDITLHSNANVFRKVVTQLLTNALEHGGLLKGESNVIIDINYQTYEQTKVTSHVLLSITDNGGGIDDEVRQKIFDPFFTGSAKPEHVGLGLHMVFNAVTSQLQGSVACTVSKSGGCCFELRLPLSIA